MTTNTATIRLEAKNRASQALRAAAGDLDKLNHKAYEYHDAAVKSAAASAEFTAATNKSARKVKELKNEIDDTLDQLDLFGDRGTAIKGAIEGIADPLKRAEAGQRAFNEQLRFSQSRLGKAADSFASFKAGIVALPGPIKALGVAAGATGGLLLSAVGASLKAWAENSPTARLEAERLETAFENLKSSVGGVVAEGEKGWDAMRGLSIVMEGLSEKFNQTTQEANDSGESLVAWKVGLVALIPPLAPATVALSLLQDHFAEVGKASQTSATALARQRLEVQRLTKAYEGAIKRIDEFVARDGRQVTAPVPGNLGAAEAKARSEDDAKVREVINRIRGPAQKLRDENRLLNRALKENRITFEEYEIGYQQINASVIAKEEAAQARRAANAEKRRAANEKALKEASDFIKKARGLAEKGQERGAVGSALAAARGIFAEKRAAAETKAPTVAGFIGLFDLIKKDAPDVVGKIKELAEESVAEFKRIESSMKSLTLNGFNAATSAALQFAKAMFAGTSSAGKAFADLASGWGDILVNMGQGILFAGLGIQGIGSGDPLTAIAAGGGMILSGLILSGLGGRLGGGGKRSAGAGGDGVSAANDAFQAAADRVLAEQRRDTTPIQNYFTIEGHQFDAANLDSIRRLRNQGLLPEAP